MQPDVTKLPADTNNPAPQSGQVSDDTPQSQVCVTTGARLHFGLFSTGDVNGRSFGGAGMMIDAPKTRVTARASDEFRAQGKEAPLADAIARRIANSFDRPLPDLALDVHSAAPRHAGLGSGTQLSLCIAAQLAHAWKLDIDATRLAVAADRGKRSGIGVQGFHIGGLLVDAGKTMGTSVAPIAERVELPESWRVLLIWPSERGSDECSNAADWSGVNGEQECQAFGELKRSSARLCSALREIALRELVPAARSGDFAAFSESVYRFNRLAGECFASVQGGIYASPTIERLISQLRELGIRGVGQSSWGPVVFAFTPNAAAAARATRHLYSHAGFGRVGVERIITAQPQNAGRVFSVGSL